MSSVPPPNWQPSSMPVPEPPRPATGSRQVRRRILGLVVAAAAVAGIVFALFGSSATKLTDPVAQAASASSDAPGYRVHMSLDISSPGTPAATGVGDGTVDLRDHLASATVSLAVNGKTLNIDEILDGATAYMKLPAAAMPALGAAGKPWVKFDLARVGRVRGLSSLGSSSAASDPSQLLRSLRSVSSGVVAEGRQEIDGIQTTQYHADLNLDQIAKSLPVQDQAITRGALEGGLGVRTLPIDVWIDASHLVRRMRMDVGTTLPSGQTASFGMTVDISDYGPQPRPVVPPAADVQDVSELLATP